MSILDEIQAARTQALKDKDTPKRTVLTTLAGEITSKAKSEGNREVTDKDCIKLLTTFRDNAAANAKLFDERDDAPSFHAACFEVKLYESFLPAAKPQLSPDALERSIRSIIANRLAGDGVKPKMGTVIADLKVLHEGEYDGKTAAQVVKAELEKTPEPS